jgi:hypothetical protein
MCSFFGILENLQRRQLGKKREEAKGLLMNFEEICFSTTSKE